MATSLLSKLSGYLPSVFSWAAKEEPEGDLPYYFWQQKHFKAAREIVNIRKTAIIKQKDDYSQLESDLGVIERLFFGDDFFHNTESAGEEGVQGYKVEALARIKGWSQKEKRQFLHRVYKMFDDAMAFEEAATVQWFGGKHRRAEAIVTEMKAHDRALGYHSVSMRTHDHDSDEIRNHVVLLNKLNKYLSSFTLSTSSALNELHFGYQAFSGLQNDALEVFQKTDDEFDAAFEEYINSVIPRLSKVSLSRVDSLAYQEKWRQRIREAQRMIGEIEAEQKRILTNMPDLVPEEAAQAPAAAAE